MKKNFLLPHHNYLTELLHNPILGLNISNVLRHCPLCLCGRYVLIISYHHRPIFIEDLTVVRMKGTIIKFDSRKLKKHVYVEK